ncbi:DHHC palmitoyltransferase-domain-containing protein [Chiua virens]|nr:DHHC palmitoyltransferase-domain-containing protein [Chiua virens]
MARRPLPLALDNSDTTRPTRSHPLSSPPTVTTFHIPSATHAGGILPSASFFHPSRPSTSPSPHSHSFPLSPIRPQPSQDSDLRRVSDSPSLHRIPPQSIRSRELLLPLSSHPKPPDPPSLSSVPPDTSCFSVSRARRNHSIDSTHNVIPITRDTSQLPPSLPVAHPIVQIPSSRPPSSTPSPNNRIYQLYPSRNRFFCAGRLLTGGDSPWAFIASLALVIAISATWFSTTCVWWWHNESPVIAAVGAYMTLLTISCMLVTAFRDPGILPRDLDPDPPLPVTSPSDGGVRVPLPRDLRVRTDTVRVKYCLTCRIYRPPRSSHCRMCDNCVDDCDHHCQWVNNCVGRRNYTFFFSFLFSAVLTLCLVICTSALHLYLLTQKDRVDFYEALNRGVGSAVAFSLSILVVWPVTALLAYHMRVRVFEADWANQIRNQAHKTLIPGAPPPNPFSFGSWRTNLAEILCRPTGFSWLDAHGIVTEDKRRVNPGLDDAGWDNDDLEEGRPLEE